jgi:hypothetical protein
MSELSSILHVCMCFLSFVNGIVDVGEVQWHAASTSAGDSQAATMTLWKLVKSTVLRPGAVGWGSSHQQCRCEVVDKFLCLFGGSELNLGTSRLQHRCCQLRTVVAKVSL